MSDVVLEGSRLQEKDAFREIVEKQMIICWNMLSKIEPEEEVGIKAKDWGSLVTLFRDIYNRTHGIIPDEDGIYKVGLADYDSTHIHLIKQYLNLLQNEGLCKIGDDEVVLSE